MVKIYIKRFINAVTRTLGRAGLLDIFESWIERHLVPSLLDQRYLSREPSLVKLRSTGTVLCTPYIRTHWTTYWFGRLYEQDLELFLMHALQPGDTYIDVGMNYGHFAFLASSIIGSKGTVEAFEPNPDLAQIVRSYADKIVPTSIVIHEVALGKESGTATLTIPIQHSGGASLLNMQNDENTTKIQVPIVCGDSVLNAKGGCRAIIKIDVEGGEPDVIAGMSNYIKQRAKAIIVEVTPEWIGGQTGVRNMFDTMAQLDCKAWRLESQRDKLIAYQCEADDVKTQMNIYFIKNGYEKDIRMQHVEYNRHINQQKKSN